MARVVKNRTVTSIPRSLKLFVVVYVDVSVEDLEEFEKRCDMQGLRADLERARQRDNKEIRSAKAQIENLIETL